MKCPMCKNSQSLPGDCHISCSNPPKTQLLIGSGGNERYAKAEKIANSNEAVVRCVWPGSGIFPIAFDDNTVFGCSNYQEKEVRNVSLS